MKRLALYSGEGAEQFEAIESPEKIKKLRNGLIKKIKESGCQVSKVKNETKWEIHGEQWKSSYLIESEIAPTKFNIDLIEVINDPEGLWIDETFE